jgi:hypothetical protein
MQHASCLNCGSPIIAADKFCPNCGQKTEIRRITFRQLGYDFFKSFIKVEKGMITLFKGLLIRPGQTAAEYLRGRRKTYFNPLAFMSVCIAFMLLYNGLLKPYTVNWSAEPAVLARIPDEHIRQLYIVSMERVNEINNFGNKYMSTLSVLISPWFAFFLWLFFKRRGWNMAEITVSYILFSAFTNLVFTIIISPLLAITKGSGFIYYLILNGSLILQTIYIAWAMKIFFNFQKPGGFWKVLGVLLLAGSTGLIFILMFYFFYAYRGEYSVVLQYL